MRISKIPLCALSSLFLVACATVPMGPTVQVMPSSTKPFQVFQQEQGQCKQYAQSQIAGQAEAANNAAVGSAVLGTLLGAAAGAAIGNHQGAGVGAATGVIAGSAIGTGSSQNAQLSIQEQYNNAYVQCMYSKGNQVPGATASISTSAPPPGVADNMAPPPPPLQGVPPPSIQPQAMTLAQAQVKLKALGYPVGQADGIMGSRTHAQLRLFQKSRSISETGELDIDTVAALTN
jgi:outer membrane lipoprotein SlyB